ncbi:MAG: ribonuclease D [Coriobacteriia bacterium]|nr:ribonuclease D [Coriobacteriia bacterium]
MYICDTQALDAVLPALEAADVLAIDTEFMRERTYYARLCLLQIATAEDVFLIDTIALEGELGRLAKVLAAPGTVKVFHAGSQDIEVLYRATGVTPGPVFDTQVAATLAGFPTQVGYAQLAKDLVDVTIDKADTFTDWSVRPLSDTQLTYAAEDVRHLIRIYALLRERLEREGRLGWLAEDFDRLADPATYEVDPHLQYLRVKRASTLDRRSLGVLREAAAWRETEAQRRDLPKRWLVSDESLVEIARRRPKSIEQLSAIRGVNERVASRQGVGLIEAIRRGEQIPEAELPRIPKRSRMPRDAQPLADLLSAVVRVRAAEHGVATTLLASRAELERFAAGEREGHPLSEGWRHTLVGAELEAILAGAVDLRIVGGHIVVVPVESVGHGER